MTRPLFSCFVVTGWAWGANSKMALGILHGDHYLHRRSPAHRGRGDDGGRQYSDFPPQNQATNVSHFHASWCRKSHGELVRRPRWTRERMIESTEGLRFRKCVFVDVSERHSASTTKGSASPFTVDRNVERRLTHRPSRTVHPGLFYHLSLTDLEIPTTDLPSTAPR
jgi:hypothetical protein